jgi:hypothetical protein
MEEGRIKQFSGGNEKDVLNILMDSDLYLELPLEERHLLLKHIMESYRSFAPSNSDC